MSIYSGIGLLSRHMILAKERKEVALVTGGAARIGQKIAISLAEAGWAVAVHFATAAADADDTVKEILSADGVAEAFEADLRNEDEVSNLIPAIIERLGTVTCLINNASIFERDSIKTTTRETWEAHMAVNLRAPFLLSQVMAENVQKVEAANVVNIIDQRVLNLTPYFSSYTISKSALWTLTQTLAMALAPKIRVNAVGPGPTLPSIRQSDSEFQRQYNAMPLKRSVKVSEICEAIRFILRTPSMTGQMITLDSGQHLGWAIPDKREDIEDE